MFSVVIRHSGLLPSRLWGGQWLCFIVLRDDLSAEDEARVLDHEKVHVRQWWILSLVFIAALAPFIGWWALLGIFLHHGLYRLRWYRKWIEIKAFVSADIMRHGKSVDWAARLLWRDYALDERLAAIRIAVRDKLDKMEAR